MANESIGTGFPTLVPTRVEIDGIDATGAESFDVVEVNDVRFDDVHEARELALETLDVHSPMPERMLCGIAEFDRALGGDTTGLDQALADGVIAEKIPIALEQYLASHNVEQSVSSNEGSA